MQEVVCRNDVQRNEDTGQGSYRVAAAAGGQHGEGYWAQRQKVSDECWGVVGAPGNPGQGSPSSAL